MILPNIGGCSKGGDGVLMGVQWEGPYGKVTFEQSPEGSEGTNCKVV